MSILILSLLLLLLVGIGVLMGRRVSAMERFQNPTPANKHKGVETFEDAPSSPSLLGQTLQMTGTVQLDTLAREMAVQDAVVEGGKKHNSVRPGQRPEPEPEPPFIPKPGPIIIPPMLGPGGQYNPVPESDSDSKHKPKPHPAPKPTPPTPAPNPTPDPPTPAPNPTPGPGPNSCGWCPACPDMSQYIRMDEIPCWNCTLP